MRTAAQATRTAAEAARLAPALLGGQGRRRYLLLVQNNAESRATGGYIGNYGVLGLDDGALRLERFGQPSELPRRVDARRPLRAPADYVRRYGRLVAANPWAYANMSPDYPTVAAVIADLYLRSDGRPVDGVIAVDPSGCRRCSSSPGRCGYEAGRTRSQPATSSRSP